MGETDWGRNLGLALMGRAMFSKSLIQFSVERQGYIPSLFDLRPNYGGGKIKENHRMGKTEGRKRRGRQRMRSLGGIIKTTMGGREHSSAHNRFLD